MTAHALVTKNFFNTRLLTNLNKMVAAIPGRFWQPGRQGGNYDKVLMMDAGKDGFVNPWCPSISQVWFLSGAIQRCLSEFAKIGTILAWDCYFIRYKCQGYIEPHTDPHPSGQHWRMNTLITKSDPVGGKFVVAGTPVYMDKGDAVLWRPDISEHWLTECTTNRFIFSVGCVIKETE